MSRGYREIIASTYTAGSLFTGYTTAKSVIPVEGLVTVPQGYFNVGRKLTVDVLGGISNIVTTPGTITFQFMLGSVVAWTSGAIQLNATAHTTLPFRLQIKLTARTVGLTTVGTLMGMGELNGVMFTRTAGQVDNVNIGSDMMVPITAPAVGTGYDSTASQTLDFWTGFSISNAGNGIQIQEYEVSSDS